MEKLRLALLSGGISSEREVSLNSGQQVFEALDKQKYDILRYDPKTDLSRLVADAPDIDVALIILHGPFGEDGTVQGLLDLLDIPYQGAGVLGSAVAMDKLVSKELYEAAGIPVPPYVALSKGERVDSAQIVSRLGLPMVVKPSAAGSSVGMSIVREGDALPTALNKAFEHDNTVLAEAYIRGTELTGGVIGNRELEALPLIEIIPGKDHEFFDYEAKYTAGATEEICPARVDDVVTEKAQNLAVMAHRALRCSGYSRTDMIWREQELYVLETNTIPGMTATSLFPQAAKAAGYDFTALLDRLIELGIKEHQRKKALR
ncbi:MAG: D-alanine--D-alanine ligase [Desulfobacteraceae bacterium]|nr:D-alanine--D-alanine ligase [Desulfobacteraceae bacterium]